MTDEDAILEAIRAAADDDAPRLVYADWLEERGDPRGEFIRIQCGLARVDLDPLRHAQFVARQQELLAGHEAEWTAGLRSVATAWSFRRGLIDEITCDASTFIAQEAAPPALATVRRVRIRNLGTEIAALASAPWLAHLEGLDLRGQHLSDAGAEILMREADLSRLRRLDLGLNMLEIDGARALAETPARWRGHLADLHTLILDHNPIHDLGAYALAASPHLAHLHTLVLDSCHLSVAAVRYLAESKTLARVEHLDLSNNEVRDEGCRTLARSKRQRSLRTLILRGNGIGPLGAKALADAPHLRALQVLDLSDNAIAGSQRDALRDRFGAGVCLW